MMRIGADIARVAALIGDPARARMLSALTSGRALTSSELALEAGVGAATASSHLSKLSEAHLVNLTQQGRNKYWSLGGEEVLRTLEALNELSAISGVDKVSDADEDERDDKLKEQLLHARACYDHLGGEYGVRLYEALLRKGVLKKDGDELHLGPNGQGFIEDMGVESLPAGKRPLCRSCLDWNGRHHLGGQLGAMLLERLIDLKMCEREAHTRVIRFTPMGEKAFSAILK